MWPLTAVLLFIAYCYMPGLLSFPASLFTGAGTVPTWEPETLDLCSQDIPLRAEASLIVLLALGCTEV